MNTSYTFNNITLKGRRSAMDSIELALFRNSIDEDVTLPANYLCEILEVEHYKKGDVREIPKLTCVKMRRDSRTELSLEFDSNGVLVNDLLKRISEVYKIYISCTYEDDSMDIGGVYICNSGLVIKDVSWTYVVHLYKHDGIDGITSEIEDAVAEGLQFEEFMGQSGLWSFISKEDRHLIEEMFE